MKREDFRKAQGYANEKIKTFQDWKLNQKEHSRQTDTTRHVVSKTYKTKQKQKEKSEGDKDK